MNKICLLIFSFVIAIYGQSALASNGQGAPTSPTQTTGSGTSSGSNPVTPQAPVCAASVAVSQAPTTLCLIGTNNAVVAKGNTWAWTCTSGSQFVNCTAPIAPPICGLPIATSSAPPSVGLCLVGTSTAVTQSGQKWIWNCTTGSTQVSNCSTAVVSTPPPTPPMPPTPVPSTKPVLADAITMTTGDGQGGLWVVAGNTLYYSNPSGVLGFANGGYSADMIPAKSVPSQYAITAMAGDGQGGMWVVAGNTLYFTNQSGVLGLENGGYSANMKAAAAVPNPQYALTSIAGDGQGGMWAVAGNTLYFSNQSGVLGLANGGYSANMKAAAAVPNSQYAIVSIAGDGQGGMWAIAGNTLYFSNQSGALGLANGGYSANMKAAAAVPDAQYALTSIAGDGQGGMWALAGNTLYFSNQSGVLGLENGGYSANMKAAAAVQDAITSIAGDGQGGMWAIVGNTLYFSNQSGVLGLANGGYSANMTQAAATPNGQQYALTSIAGDGQGGMWAVVGNTLYFSNQSGVLGLANGGYSANMKAAAAVPDAQYAIISIAGDGQGGMWPVAGNQLLYCNQSGVLGFSNGGYSANMVPANQQ